MHAWTSRDLGVGAGWAFFIFVKLRFSAVAGMVSLTAHVPQGLNVILDLTEVKTMTKIVDYCRYGLLE